LNLSLNDGTERGRGIGQSEILESDLKLDLSNKEWYAFEDNYGTSEEKYLVKFIEKNYTKLRSKFTNIYLLRNEKHFQIYNFEDGRAFEPDFVLFLEHKKLDKSVHYQIFLEPKGSHLLEADKWKEDFLKALKDEHRLEMLWKTKEYVIWGMPFFNEEHRKTEFESAFHKLLD
jgi:type III restriction enzyme